MSAFDDDDFPYATLIHKLLDVMLDTYNNKDDFACEVLPFLYKHCTDVLDVGKTTMKQLEELKRLLKGEVTILYKRQPGELSRLLRKYTRYVSVHELFAQCPSNSWEGANCAEGRCPREEGVKLLQVVPNRPSC